MLLARRFERPFRRECFDLKPRFFAKTLCIGGAGPSRHRLREYLAGGRLHRVRPVPVPSELKRVGLTPKHLVA